MMGNAVIMIKLEQNLVLIDWQEENIVRIFTKKAARSKNVNSGFVRLNTKRTIVAEILRVTRTKLYSLMNHYRRRPLMEDNR